MLHSQMWVWVESNYQRMDLQTTALPLSYRPIKNIERYERLELSSLRWKRSIIQYPYTNIAFYVDEGLELSTAQVEGFGPPTSGFGDQCSTN